MLLFYVVFCIYARIMGVYYAQCSAKLIIYVVLSAKLRTFNLIFLNLIHFYYRRADSASAMRRMASSIFSSLVA